MKVEISVQDLVEAGPALDRFQALPLRANKAFSVMRTLKALRAESKDFFEVQGKMLDKLGLKLIPVGPGQNHVVKKDPEMTDEDMKKAQDKFIEERDELYKTVIELDVDPIPLSIFYKANGVVDFDKSDNWFEFPADDMETLSFLIVDDVRGEAKKPELKQVK